MGKANTAEADSMRPIQIACLLAGCLSLPLAAGHQHRPHAPAPAAEPAQRPAVVPAGEAAVGARHATDEPLRRHMQAIRADANALGHLEHGQLDPGQVRVLAQRIGGHVRGIIAECRLPPAADGDLHAIIAPMMQSAQALLDDPRDPAPVARLRAALAGYDRQFDDPANGD